VQRIQSLISLAGKRRSATQIMTSAEREAERMGRASGELVIVVDDDPGFSAALARVLRGRGHRVECAVSAEQARAICSRESGAVMAIIDLQLGGQSGIETLHELKLLNPLLRAVIVSAYCSVSSTVAAMRAGAVDCIPKYAGIDSILNAFVSQTLRRHDGKDDSVPSLAQVEWDHIQRVMNDCGGNLTAAAHRLGIPRRTLQRKLRRHSPR
jgi:two-component system response regulator RegA